MLSAEISPSNLTYKANLSVSFMRGRLDNPETHPLYGKGLLP